jgi:hypothetical protein
VASQLSDMISACRCSVVLVPRFDSPQAPASSTSKRRMAVKLKLHIHPANCSTGPGT